MLQNRVMRWTLFQEGVALLLLESKASILERWALFEWWKFVSAGGKHVLKVACSHRLNVTYGRTDWGDLFV